MSLFYVKIIITKYSFTYRRLNMKGKKTVIIKFWALKEKRKEKKITQLKMAELIGVSLPQYKNYESGFVRMPKERVIKICDIVGSDYNELLHFDFEGTEREYEYINRHNNRKKEYLDKLAYEFKVYHRSIKGNMPKLRYILNSNNLKEIRQKSGRSAIDVSELLGISRQTYAKYEKEQCAVSENMLSKICILFEVNKEEIISCDIHDTIKDAQKERFDILIERTNEIKNEYADVCDEVNIDFKNKILFAFI